MPTRTRRSLYNAVPRSHLRLRRLLWAMATLGVALGCMALWGQWLTRGELTSFRQYVGQISPNTDPIVISLPKGAVIEEILTTRNDQIEAGQTLVTLDVDAMQRRVDAISATLLHDDVLHDCLLSETLPEAAQLLAAFPEGMQDKLQLAVQSCEAALTAKADITSALEAALNNIATEQGLIARYMSVLSASATMSLSTQAKQADARQALALALLRNKLEHYTADLKLQADRDLAQWNDTRLARIRSLSERIQVQSELRQAMLENMDRPRLQAPKGGMVVNVRALQSYKPQSQDIELIELRPNGGHGYDAHFDLTETQLAGLQPGDTVRMTMLGILDGGPILFGQVSDMQTVGGQRVRANVVLDDSSVSKLDDPSQGIALRGRGTASVIQVRKAEQSLAATLRSHLHETLKLDRFDQILQPPFSQIGSVAFRG